MDETTFLTRIRRTNGVYDKGVEVKADENAAHQSFHAFLGAYGYGHDPNTDYVACYIMTLDGRVLDWKVDDRRPHEEPSGEGA